MGTRHTKSRGCDATRKHTKSVEWRGFHSDLQGIREFVEGCLSSSLGHSRINSKHTAKPIDTFKEAPCEITPSMLAMIREGLPNCLLWSFTRIGKQLIGLLCTLGSGLFPISNNKQFAHPCVPYRIRHVRFYINRDTVKIAQNVHIIA